MKKNSRKQNTVKWVIIVSCSLAALAVLLCLSAYLLMHRYISKINYVPLEEANSSYIQLPSEEEVAGTEDQYATGSKGSSAGQTSRRSQGAVTASSNGSIGTEQSTLPSDTFDGAKENEVSDFSDVAACARAVSKEEEELLEERILKNVRNNTDLGKEDDVLNLLLIGTDNRSEYDQGLSDSMLLLSINEDTRKITIVSLLRDIYLYIPDKDTFNRLNASYAYGGSRLLIKTIEENFKIEIDKYASIDFFSFIEVIDSLGGIELRITEEELPRINELINELNRIQGKGSLVDYVKESGTQLLNGRQVLAYSRVRSVGTDFGRTARQRMALEQIYTKAREMGVQKTTKLLDILLPHVTTNFTEKEIISQILSLSDYMDYDYNSFGIPMEGTYENLKICGMQILAIDFEENIKKLQELLYNNE